MSDGVKMTGPGRLVVLSAPSGSGKTTLARRLVADLPRLVESVSYTTRRRRSDEEEGVDYPFVDRQRFVALADENAFLEWAEIYGEMYGTGLEASRQILGRGDDLLLVIDLQGARWVRKRMPEALFLFLMPPGHGALVERLRQRGTESTGTVAQRLEVAREEIRAWKEYDYLIINDDFDQALADLQSIVRHRKLQRSYRKNHYDDLLAELQENG